MARVLIVDNNKLVVELLERCMRDRGYEIDRAYDGLEAIDRVRAQLPDVIVTDLVMPKVDGKKLCRYLKQNPPTSGIPIVVVSGTASEDHESFRNVMADAYLAKCAYDKLLPNVLATVERLLAAKSLEPPESIIGIEEITPREMVREFTVIKKHYDAILDCMAEGVVELDPSGRITMVNPAAQGIFALDEPALLGKRPEELVDAAGCEQVRQAIEAATEGGQPEFRIDYGGKVLVFRFSPIIQERKFHGVFMTVRDITREAELEEQAKRYTQTLEREVRERTLDLERRNEELRRANKVKDDFLGMLSHELRTPITPIKGYIEILRDHVEEEALREKALGVLARQSDHLEQLLTDLLDLTAVTAGRLTIDSRPCDLNQEVRAVAGAVASEGRERKIELSLALCDGTPNVQADPMRFRQIVRNIICNAFKFSAGDSVIDVATRCQSGVCRVSVADRGIGISTEDQKNIFDDFHQIDSSITRKYSGLGIGLALAKKLCEVMGGDITVESQQGKGSVFTVEIPELVRGTSQDLTSPASESIS